MSLPRHLFTPAFRTQHLGRSFAVIVGIMVFVATFAVVVEAGLLGVGYSWGRTMESRITVEIPAVGDESSVPQSERVKQAMSVLRAMPEIGLVIPLSDDEVEKLLHPWFKQTELLRTLPLPALIDVERKPGAPLTIEKIETSLHAAISDARVDDHGEWTRDVWRLVNGLTLLGGLTILLTGATLVIAVSLLCRAVMAAEKDTISLLHLLGAEDADIARHFQSQTEKLSARAAATGFITALASAGLLMLAARSVADFSRLDMVHWTLLGIGACAVPVCAIAISTATARFSVMRLLRAFP